jgi:hypothetical protein
VLGAGERRHLDRDHRHAAQRDGERRDTRAHAAHVADDHRVAAKRLGVRGRVGRQCAAADLLLALDDDLDADRRPALPRAQRSDVGHDVRLGVRSPAAEDRAVALVGHERGRAPQRLVAGRHDVVMRVQQHRRGAVGRRDLARDHRRGVGQLERAKVLHAGVAQQLDRQRVGVEDRLARLGIADRRDRGDGHQARQVGPQRGHQLRHGFGDRSAGGPDRIARHDSSS